MAWAFRCVLMSEVVIATWVVAIFPDVSSAQSLSLEQERALKPKGTFKECDKCPEMVVVPAGSFTMGSPTSEPERATDEGPQHLVTLAKPFFAPQWRISCR